MICPFLSQSKTLCAERDKVSEGSLPGPLLTKDGSWCYSGWFESRHPPNAFDLFGGTGKGLRGKSLGE